MLDLNIDVIPFIDLMLDFNSMILSNIASL